MFKSSEELQDFLAPTTLNCERCNLTFTGDEPIEKHLLWHKKQDRLAEMVNKVAKEEEKDKMKALRDLLEANLT